MTKHKFKFHGESDGYSVFSLVNENGWMNYKLDNNNNKVIKIAHDDIDLVKLNTSITSVNGDIEHSKSNSTTLLETNDFYNYLIRHNVLLDGLGSINAIEVDYLQVYDVNIELSNGKVIMEKYNGINEEDAIRVAKINNPLFESGAVIQ